jgi:trans-2-enoyl-CoA reductase
MGRALYIAENGLALRPFSPQITDPKRQCLVKMLASTVHPADTLSIAGHYPRESTIAGNEGVGEIISAPSGGMFKPGDRVIMNRSDISGVWAEQQVFDMDHLFAVPKELSLEEAAVLRINPGTAFQLLKKYGNSEHLLLSAANSQVGRFVLQLSNVMSPGLDIVGLVRSNDRLREMEEMFPKHKFFLDSNSNWINYCKNWKTGAAFDCVGGELAGRMLKALPPKSILCTYGAISGEPLKVGVGQFIFEGKRVEGFWASEWFRTADAPVVRDMLDKLAIYFKQGILKTTKYGKVQFDSINNDAELKSNTIIMF